MASSKAYVKNIGRFEIYADDDHRLGKGAMGIVYKGYDPKTDNEVAAKKITFEAEFERDYTREAELLRRLPSHDNVIKLYDWVRSEQTVDGIRLIDLWIIMECCKLGNLIKFARLTPLSEIQKVNIMYQASMALEHLHSLHVAHRDIKPDNLLLTGDSKAPQLKLADFGMARIVGRDSGGKSLPMHSMTGTMEYWAPEQFTKKNGQFDYDKTVDIFSLGLTLLALLLCSQCSIMEVYMVKEECLGKAMHHMLQQHGSTWGGFVPKLDEPTDSPLAGGVKKIITKMIQTQPGDRLPMDQVVPQLAALMPAHSGVRAKTATATRPRDGAVTPTDAPTTSSAVPRSVPCIVKRLGRHGVEANVIAGLSERGDIVIASSGHISLLRLRGQEYEVDARMKLPDNVLVNCSKAVDVVGRVLVQAERNKDTRCLDSEGRELYRHEHPGRLLCSIENELFYEESTDKGYRISVQRGKGKKATFLQPPQRWNWHLSVCRHKDRYFVTEHDKKSLDIFTTEGRHIHHETLPFEPRAHNAIAATKSGHVLIVQYQPPAVHIYNEGGKEVGKFTKEQMKLEEDRIHGISYSREDGVLHVLAGNYDIIRSLQAYRIEYK